ncbi:hypothetical protein ACS0TY_035383 [Phlomoides rotata]
MGEDGRVEISGSADPNKLLDKIGRSRKVEVLRFQFGQCSKNLNLPPENQTKPATEEHTSSNPPYYGYEYGYYPPAIQNGYGYHYPPAIQEDGYGYHYPPAIQEDGYGYHYPPAIQEDGYGYYYPPASNGYHYATLPFRSSMVFYQ